MIHLRVQMTNLCYKILLVVNLQNYSEAVTSEPLSRWVRGLLSAVASCLMKEDLDTDYLNHIYFYQQMGWQNAPFQLKLRAINLFPAGILAFQRANSTITTSDFTKAHIQPNTGACSSCLLFIWHYVFLSMIILHKVVDTQLDRNLNVQALLSLSGLNGNIFWGSFSIIKHICF